MEMKRKNSYLRIRDAPKAYSKISIVFLACLMLTTPSIQDFAVIPGSNLPPFENSAQNNMKEIIFDPSPTPNWFVVFNWHSSSTHRYSAY
jgi:hypothetical protein